MKKHLFAMLLVLALFLNVVACTDDPSAGDTTTAPDDDTTTTVAPDDGTTTAEPDDGTTTAEPDDGTTTTAEPDDGNDGTTTTAEPDDGNDGTTTTAAPDDGDDDPDGGATTTAPITYTVIWKNDDGTVLETDEGVAAGVTPSYDGAAPTKAADEQYTYTFKGWTPTVVAVIGDATYTAEFTATPVVPSHTVAFVDPDGATIETKSVEEGTALSAPPATMQGPINTGATCWKDGEGNLYFWNSYSTYETATGWTDAAGEPVDLKVTKDLTLTQWSAVLDLEQHGGAYNSKFEFYQVIDLHTTIIDLGAWDLSEYSAVRFTYGRDAGVTGHEVLLLDQNTDKTATPVASAALLQTPAGWVAGATTVTIDLSAANEAYDNLYIAASGSQGVSCYRMEFIYKGANTYTVTWKVDGQTDVTESYAEGVTPSHADPVKEPDAENTYTFIGWTPAIAVVTGDATYTAQFETTPAATVGTVTFVDREGTTIETKIVEKGTSLSAPPATMQGPINTSATCWKDGEGNIYYWNTYSTYETATGWTDAAGEPVDLKVTGDLTLTAWSVVLDFSLEQFNSVYNSYKFHQVSDLHTKIVDLGAWDLSEYSAVRFTYGRAASVTGHEVLLLDQNTDKTATPVASAALAQTSADWVAGATTVTIDLSAANEEYDNLYLAASGNQGVSCYRIEFIYKGANTYTVTWKVDGQDDVTESYAEGVTPSHADPVKEPDAENTYTFIGWTPAIAVVTGDAIYTAQFEATPTANICTVTFVNREGTTIKTETLEKGEAVPAPAANTPVLANLTATAWRDGEGNLYFWNLHAKTDEVSGWTDANGDPVDLKVTGDLTLTQWSDMVDLTKVEGNTTGGTGIVQLGSFQNTTYNLGAWDLSKYSAVKITYGAGETKESSYAGKYVLLLADTNKEGTPVASVEMVVPNGSYASGPATVTLDLLSATESYENLYLACTMGTNHHAGCYRIEFIYAN